jgi:hypothetical protein
MHDISQIVTESDFEKIAQFVLDNGNRIIYCQMYNDSPHYSLEDFHIYLDPISQSIESLLSGKNSLYSVNYYNTIVIQDWNSPHVYYRILLKDEKVYIHNPYGFEQKYYENELL